MVLSIAMNNNETLKKKTNPATTKPERAHAGFNATLHLKTMNERGRRLFNHTRRNSRTRPH
ncbi:MAG: hypothetical protein UR81_C0023G0004 [Candidatus Levybacteria bacterium GW2011_GWB1_35_5]|nr:MAG: hypothetical protein UR81_C0023G0004 [Candidatus Levybacteria bacterium GW2011_GWB1_35_5]